jgi:hypothetical protein
MTIARRCRAVGINRTTLLSRMKKFVVAPSSFDSFNPFDFLNFNIFDFWGPSPENSTTYGAAGLERALP